LLHFSLRFQEDGAIFVAVVGFTTMKHAIQGSNWVRASGMTAAAIWCAASLAMLIESLIEGSWVSFVWDCPKILLPILRWPTAVRIDVVHW
jgi:hypothetical protein